MVKDTVVALPVMVVSLIHHRLNHQREEEGLAQRSAVVATKVCVMEQRVTCLEVTVRMREEYLWIDLTQVISRCHVSIS